MEIDKETREIMQAGEKIERLVDNDAWKEVKKKLFDKLITFDSITGIPKDKKSLEEIGKEAVLREAVVSIILDWIKDIEGIANQSKNNKKTFEGIIKVIYINI